MNIEMPGSSPKVAIAKDKENNNRKTEVLGQTDPDPLSQDRVCLHSRKLFSLISSNDEVSSFEYMRRHFQECSFCQNQYYKLLKLKTEIIKNIPDVMPDKTMQDSYAMEISEMLAKVESRGHFAQKPEMFLDKIFSFFSTLNH